MRFTKRAGALALVLCFVASSAIPALSSSQSSLFHQASESSIDNKPTGAYEWLDVMLDVTARA